jgi:hypothetical protein
MHTLVDGWGAAEIVYRADADRPLPDVSNQMFTKKLFTKQQIITSRK